MDDGSDGTDSADGVKEQRPAESGPIPRPWLVATAMLRTRYEQEGTVPGLSDLTEEELAVVSERGFGIPWSLWVAEGETVVRTLPAPPGALADPEIAAWGARLYACGAIHAELDRIGTRWFASDR